MPQKGVRFWLPAVVYIPGLPPKKSSEPFRGIVAGDKYDNIMIAEAHYPNIRYQGKPLFVRGELWIDDSATIRELLKGPANLRFDPQEVVDKGYLPAQEVQAMGYPKVIDTHARPVEVVTPPAIPTFYESAPENQASPDLDVMTKEELVDFASDNAIPVQVRNSKHSILETIRKALRD
jgi:hypothetical protein